MDPFDDCPKRFSPEALAPTSGILSVRLYVTATIRNGEDGFVHEHLPIVHERCSPEALAPTS